MALRLRSYILLIVFTFVVLVVLVWPQLLSYGAQYALRSAQSPTMRLSWTGAQGSRGGVHFDSIEALFSVSTGSRGPIKSLPVKLSVSNVWVKPSLISALLNQQAATFSADLFEGSVSGSVSGALGSPLLSLAWSDIELAALARYPAIRALGLNEGVFEGTVTLTAVDSAARPDTTFSATLRDFAIPRNTLSSVLKVQPGELVTISVSGASSRNSVSLQQLSLSGFFGKILSTGTIGLSPDGEAQEVNLSTDVQLSDSGSQRFGQWLPLASNNVLDARATAFTVRSRTVSCPSGGHPYTLQLGHRTLCFSNQFNRKP